MTPFKELIVNVSQTIKQLLHVINQTSMGIVLVVDDNGVFIRTATDGDIRRYLLDGGSIDDTISQLPQITSYSATVDTPESHILEVMRKQDIKQVPVLDDNGQVIGMLSEKDVCPILLSVPHLGEAEQEYVKQAFDSNWIAPLGPNVDAFEAEIGNYTGAKYALAVSSGTAAIHLSLILAGVTRDDIVLCSSFTFVASANPILYQGAVPVFVDSEDETWNMCPDALEDAIKYCAQQGKLPKAVIVVHLYGQSADMDRIVEVCRRYGVLIIEDAAESLGSKYGQVHTGTIGKFGIYSFNGNKIITTSGGGMLVSDDEEKIKKARFLSTQAKEPCNYYEHKEVGYNYRMSNVLAGIGRGQLEVIEERIGSRRRIFERYKNQLQDLDIVKWSPELNNSYSNRWLTVMFLESNKEEHLARNLIKQFSAHNIECRHTWKPMHMQPLFADALFFRSESNTSEKVFEQGICLPSASNMTDEEQERVIATIRDVLS